MKCVYKKYHVQISLITLIRYNDSYNSIHTEKVQVPGNITLASSP